MTPWGTAWGFSCRVTFPSMVKKIQLHGAGSGLLWDHPAVPLSPLPLAKAHFSAETPLPGQALERRTYLQGAESSAFPGVKHVKHVQGQ